MSTHGRNGKIISLTLAAAVLVFYQVLYAFSFFPLTEGWFSAYGILIRSGKIPYRDFPLLMTPLYPTLVAIVQTIFGDGFLPLRVIGVLVTTGIGVALWKILSEYFNPWPSAFGAVVACIYYQSGVAYIGYDFTQVVTLFLLVGVYFMIKDAGNDGRNRSRLMASPAFLAGVFLAAAAMTKQSNGGVATVVLSIAYVYVTVLVHGKSERIVRLFLYAGGLVSVVSCFMFVLVLQGSVGDFFQQVVIDAMRAKGGSGKIFSAWITGIVTSPSLLAQSKELITDFSVIIALTALPGISFMLARKRTISQLFSSDNDGMSLTLISVSGLLLIVAVVVRLRYGGVFYGEDVRDQGALVYNNVILMALFLYLAGSLISAVMLVIRPSEKTGKFLLLFSFGVALMAANGTSAGLSEISSFVGLGILLSFLLTLSAPLVIPSIVPIGISLLLLAFVVEKKFEMPYAWWSIKTQDVRSSLMRVKDDRILYGIEMEEDKYRKIKAIVSAIKQYTRKEDRLYVFPHMPVFNMMSDRKPYENVVVSWFDFMDIRSGSHLVERIRKNTPKVMVVARLPEDVFMAHERLFNGGMPCVQRKIISEIKFLEKEKKIWITKSYEMDGMIVDLYVRRN